MSLGERKTPIWGCGEEAVTGQEEEGQQAQDIYKNKPRSHLKGALQTAPLPVL